MRPAPALLACLICLVTCDRGSDASTPPGKDAIAEGAVEVPTLPETMLGTFVPAGADEPGRVLIVSEDMVAAIACADCGLPTYVRLESIACQSGESCDVTGDGCRGRIERGADGLTVSLTGEGDAADRCRLYDGTFVPGEAIGTVGQVVASTDAPGGHVVIGDITSPREIDLDASRLIADGRVAELDACYQAALIDAPSLSGWLVVEVVHGARGVSKAPASVHESGFSHPSVGDCLAHALAGQDYPVAADGLPAPVYYTLELVLR